MLPEIVYPAHQERSAGSHLVIYNPMGKPLFRSSPRRSSISMIEKKLWSRLTGKAARQSGLPWSVSSGVFTRAQFRHFFDSGTTASGPVVLCAISWNAG